MNFMTALERGRHAAIIEDSRYVDMGHQPLADQPHSPEQRVAHAQRLLTATLVHDPVDAWAHVIYVAASALIAADRAEQGRIETGEAAA
jgi:hypothetical protein